MALSTFITTLLLNGFSVKFSPDGKLKFNVFIEKDGAMIRHVVEMPIETTGDEFCNILYETLQKAYAEYNMTIKNTN